jgi:hypothetical protein
MLQLQLEATNQINGVSPSVCIPGRKNRFSRDSAGQKPRYAVAAGQKTTGKT